MPRLGDDGKLSLSGAGEPGATLAILANGKKIGEALVDAKGKWQFDAGKLDPGDYKFGVQTLDQAGKLLNQAPDLSFTVLKPATEASCFPYVVTKDDWLSKLAQEYLGDTNEYTKIVEATNAMAEKDPSFVIITNPDRIEPGQKLCIPK